MGEFARQGRQEEALWEAFQDLFLTLQETGARAKGALHALAPHCLRPFMRLTPEVVQGEAPTGTPTNSRAESRKQQPPFPQRRTRVFSTSFATRRLRAASSTRR